MNNSGSLSHYLFYYQSRILEWLLENPSISFCVEWWQEFLWWILSVHFHDLEFLLFQNAGSSPFSGRRQGTQNPWKLFKIRTADFCSFVSFLCPKRETGTKVLAFDRSLTTSGENRFDSIHNFLSIKWSESTVVWSSMFPKSWHLEAGWLFPWKKGNNSYLVQFWQFFPNLES